MFNRNQDALKDIIIFSLCTWGFWQTQPLTVHGQVQWIPALCAVIGFVLGFRLLQTGLLNLSRLLDWLSAYTPSGKEGTSRWGKYKDFKPELTKENGGPYWCVAIDKPKKPLLIDYASNALTIAPAGSGKGICTVIPTALSISASKIIPDFKGGELTCVLKPALEARGENVIIINAFEQFTDIVGDTGRYNPLDTIVLRYLTPGALRDVPGLVRELSLQLYPEPGSGESDDTHWREGGRVIIRVIIVIETVTKGFDADLSDVAMTLKDRQSFEQVLRWIIGIDLKGKPLKDGPMPIESIGFSEYHSEEDMHAFAADLRAEAASILKLMITEDTKTFDSYVSGAQQKLAAYAFGRLSPVLRNSTFSMSELKADTEEDGASTLLIMGDPSRPEDTQQLLSLIQWGAIAEMKHHPNKHVPVYFIFDEATNYKIHDVVNLMTYGRGFGIRCHFIFQALKAFQKKYGGRSR